MPPAVYPLTLIAVTLVTLGINLYYLLSDGDPLVALGTGLVQLAVLTIGIFSWVRLR